MNFNLEGGFIVTMHPHLIFTINSEEFKAVDGLQTIVKTLIKKECRDKRLLALSMYSNVDLVFRNRALPTQFNLTLIDRRPDPPKDWPYNPWAIKPGVLPKNKDIDMVKKRGVIRIGHYYISPNGTSWELYSELSGNKTTHSDLSVCVWILYNWGCVENSSSDPDKLIEFCAKWLAFINSKTIPYGIELVVNEETKVQLSNFWENLDDQRRSLQRRESQVHPKVDQIAQRAETKPVKRGRPSKSKNKDK